jgi:V-type H+-transporting ATPase subunit a
MTFGICLQLWNHRHFKKPLNIWAEFVPQLLFFESIFGYLGILIVTKWCTDWYSEGLPPPNLLNTLIYMFLSPGKVEPDSQIYSGQSGVQIFLLMLALVCVPWMLIPKPLILNAEHKASGKKAHDEGPDEEHGTFHEDTEALLGEGSPAAAAAAHSSGGGGGGHDDEEFDFGEIVIHQVIHTIEFCLGAVSNTASYLRLWALSLAHAQLSEVLYTMTLNAMFTLEVDPMYKAIAIALGFAVWFILTVGILLVMEGLSAFLHALRLHWVEFQNKVSR